MSTLSRRDAVGLAAGAVAVAMIPLGTGAVAAERADPTDVKSLNAALALERAAAKAYGDALAANLCSPPVAAVMQRFEAEHTAAEQAIVAALGQMSATVSTDAATVAAESFKTEGDVLAYAYPLERSIAIAYVQGVAGYKNRDLATLTASILGVTTTHVALLAEALRSGAPYATGMVVA